MGLMSILSGFGLKAFNAKFAIEIFSKQIINHVKHSVDNYDMTVNFKTGFMEFMVYYPLNTKEGCPDSYMPPKNLMFKGKPRKVPQGARLYDMDIKGNIDMINEFVSMQIPDFDGDIDYVILKVDRNKAEVPCEIYYQDKDGNKEKFKHVLK